MIQIFKNPGSKIEIKTNLTLNLLDGTYKPYNKSNEPVVVCQRVIKSSTTDYKTTTKIDLSAIVYQIILQTSMFLL